MGSQELGGEMVDAANSGGQFEELVDELNLTPNIRSAHPPNLPLPHHVHRFITLNGSLRRLELSEPLLVVHPAFDRSWSCSRILFKYCMGRCRQRRRKIPSFLCPSAGNAASYWQTQYHS